jgi:hypothetical protein
MDAFDGTGRHWTALDGARRHWTALDGTGRHWTALDGTRRRSTALGGTRRRWAALDGARRRSTALDGAGRDVGAWGVGGRRRFRRGGSATLHRASTRGASADRRRCTERQRVGRRRTGDVARASTRGASAVGDVARASTRGASAYWRRSGDGRWRESRRVGAQCEWAQCAQARGRHRVSARGASASPISPRLCQPTFTSQERAAETMGVGTAAVVVVDVLRGPAARGDETPERGVHSLHPSNHAPDENGSMPFCGAWRACFLKFAST